MIVFGHICLWVERGRVLLLPAFVGWELLFLSVIGVVLTPFSGIWLVIPVAIYIIAVAQRGGVKMEEPTSTNPGDFNSAIGAIITNFAALDGVIPLFISQILARLSGARGLSEQSMQLQVGHIVSVEVPFSAKVGVFSSLYRLAKRDDRAVEEFEALLDRAIEAEGKRD